MNRFGLQPMLSGIQFNARYYYYLYVLPGCEYVKRVVNKHTGLFQNDMMYSMSHGTEMISYKKNTKINESLFEKMRTGDIILFNTHGSIFADVVEFGTDSQYSHVAMILTPPHFESQLNENERSKGKILILESGFEFACTDVENDRHKFGVQIVEFNTDYLNALNGNVYWRPLLDSDTGEAYFDKHHEEINNAVADVHQSIHDKPYDVHPLDFIKAGFDIPKGNNQLTDRYFCSSLVAYLYYKMNLFPSPEDIHHGWDLVTPKMWSVDGKRALPFIEGVKLGGQYDLKYEECKSAC